MAHTRNSVTDTQDADQETISTIVAQVPHDPVPPPTAAPAQATISPEVGQMFNAVNSAIEMFKAFMANQNERRDEIPPQSNRQNNSKSSRVNEFVKLSPSMFHGSIVDKDLILWLEGVKKAVRVMKAFDDEAVELAAYHLRDVSGAWFEIWENERDEDDGLPTWEEFEGAFMANFIREEDREAKASEFEHLKQGSKSVQKYYMEFIRLAKHAPHMVKTEKAKIRRFNGTSSGGGRDSSNKESLAPAQSSHQSGGGSSFRRTQNYGNQSRQNQNFRTSSSHSQSHAEQHSHQQSLCGTCKQQHSDQCKLEFHGCYHYRDIGHIKANCPKLQRNFSGGSTRPSSSSATTVASPQARGSHNQTRHGAGRDPGSTFSYVTPYFAINLGLEPEQLSEPFLVSTPVGESVKVTTVYKGCIVSVQGRNTKTDLIELEMVDFDVIMGMDWLSSC
ncbi:uncharacterized protein [Nicotiana sylvestris]|uniref:uncharacterized protein n=1 Tax=Nicotiana sylvestris TaxID=4096 RepID=UPI00388CD14A